MEIIIELICFKALTNRFASFNCSGYEAIDPFCLLKFKKIDSSSIFGVVAIDVDDTDDDWNGDCDVDGLTCAVNYEGYHDFNENGLTIFEIHY